MRDEKNWTGDEDCEEEMTKATVAISVGLGLIAAMFYRQTTIDQQVEKIKKSRATLKHLFNDLICNDISDDDIDKYVKEAKALESEK